MSQNGSTKSVEILSQNLADKAKLNAPVQQQDDSEKEELTPGKTKFKLNLNQILIHSKII